MTEKQEELIVIQRNWGLYAGLCAVLLWLLLIGTIRASAYSSDDGGGTIPPIDPFIKSVQSTAGKINTAYSDERVYFTLSVRTPISPNYSARIGVTDTLPISLALDSTSITATNGTFDAQGNIITWTFSISAGASSSLTYAARTPSVLTPTMLIPNQAVLYEIENLDGGTPPTSKTITRSVALTVHPRSLYLPVIAVPIPKSTLTQPANYSFEDTGSSAWAERGGKLIYSIQESPLPMIGDNNEHYAWLGGAPSQSNELTQTISLPSDYSDVRLRYLYWIQSDDDRCAGGDIAQIKIDGEPIRTFELCKTNRTFDPAKGHGWRRDVLDLANFKGRSVDLAFFTNLNQDKNSNFFVDVVQLCSSDTDAPSGTVRCDDPPTP